MKIRIHITKEVLRRSAECSAAIKHDVAANCAISVAVRDLLPGSVTHTRVIHPAGAHCKDGCFCESADGYIPLPPIAADFIQEFDTSSFIERISMTPFSFEIDVPDAVIETIGITEARRILAESVTLEEV